MSEHAPHDRCGLGGVVWITGRAGGRARTGGARQGEDGGRTGGGGSGSVGGKVTGGGGSGGVSTGVSTVSVRTG